MFYNVPFDIFNSSPTRPLFLVLQNLYLINNLYNFPLKISLKLEMDKKKLKVNTTSCLSDIYFFLGWCLILY
jgi:hypothetical protein